MHNPKEHKCLKPILGNLQEASRGAVVDGSQVLEENSFKEYFHVKRPIQEELETIIKSANKHHKQLVLVCGNVGDGKSHLLSLLHQACSEEMKSFTVHNDATESNNPKETYLDTLEKLLDNFKDENLNNDYTTDKIILAINLGTLTNFLAERGEGFKQLKGYVEENNILDTTITNQKTGSDVFSHVNFADYHLYELTEQGASSEIILSLFQRLTQTTPENPVWASYQSHCVNCELAEKCPIKFNYEFVMDKQVQEKIMHLLIKCIVQYKHLISIRALLNFLHDLIVPLELAPLSVAEMYTRVKHYQTKTFINNILPNYLFEHPDLSAIYKHLQLLDPVNQRKEDLDQTIIQLIITDNVKETFEKEVGLPLQFSFFHKFLNEGFQDKSHKKSSYILLINLFTRWNYFKTKQKGGLLENQIYQKYLQSLYYFNSESTPTSSAYQQLYKEIKDAIYKWNGNAFQADMVNVFIGHKQDTYKISQSLNLKPKAQPRYVSPLKTVLKKFKDTITLYYGVDSNSIDYQEISIDYELYHLLQKVIKGYRPNKLDKSNHINFVHIVDKIISLNSQNTPLIFHENNGKSKNGYRLSIDDFGKYQFEKI